MLLVLFTSQHEARAAVNADFAHQHLGVYVIGGHCKLELSLSGFEQSVKCCITLDKCPGNIKKCLCCQI